jgi:hypothetical protein
VISADRDTELNRLKALVEKLADKVNVPRDTPEARFGAVEDRVDEVALHDVRLGTTLGLAAMAMHTGVDYSTRLLRWHAGGRRRHRGHSRAPGRPWRRYCRFHPPLVRPEQAV